MFWRILLYRYFRVKLFPFTHKPLDRTYGSLRLLKLHHRETDAAPIKCTISHEQLAAEPQPVFQALSYTWGPRSANLIFVNDRSFFVHDNLFGFLAVKSLDADFCRDNWLWADQICIDQASVEERNHQVKQMQDVYSKASLVYIWLGQTTEKMTRAVDLISQPVDDAIDTTCGLGSADSRDLFEHFGLQDYWSRLWIIQEVTLAREIRVFVGCRTVHWERIEALVSHFPARLATLIGLRSAREPYKDSKLDWLEVLAVSKDSACLDIRDRIFGVRGLVNQNLWVPVDYEHDARTIMLSVLYVQARHLHWSNSGLGYFQRSSMHLGALEELTGQLSTALCVAPSEEDAYKAFTQSHIDQKLPERAIQPWK